MMADLVEEALDLDPRRNQSSERKKLYEEMLLSEIPGTARVNEPMHAVLESDLGPSNVGDGQSVRNHALIHYLATLATSNSRNDMFDFDFVESLLRNGADVNSSDKTGQTVFHEVARSWNIDVASFLIKHGADVNLQDTFGRSPLHVAAAVDYAEMVEFLIQNGANAESKTCGEEQTPMHFAAKNDAVHSLQALLSNGANFDARDSKNRSPLQVAAEMNRAKTARLLIKEGAPTGVCDNLGNSALSLLIEKIPEVALEAMDQFHSVDTINRKQFYFLNYLEGPRLKEQKTPAKTPLEIAVQNERFDVILHPVMQRLIGLKWQVYGKWGAILDLIINLAYSILWTVLGVTLPTHGLDLYLPLKEKYWRLAIGAVLFLLTVFEIKKQITDTVKTRRELKKWKEWRASELEKDFEYCHPRWPQETQYLKAEIKAVRNLSLISGSDHWIYFDWLTLLLIMAAIVSHLVFFRVDAPATMHVHRFSMILLLVVLWFRIFKYARPFESAGPFVVIFGCVLGDIVKWGFLNIIIIVPFTCAFWITFGKISLTPVEGYDNVGPLVYNMFSMMVGVNHNFEKLEAANAFMARLLCGAFIGLASIVTINLLIALLTNTFERLYQNAVANAVMQRARTILLLQKSLRRAQKVAYYKLVRDKGSPEVINTDLGGLPSPQDRGNRATLEGVREDLSSLLHALGDPSGKRRNKGKNELDVVKADVAKVRRLQEELARDFVKTTALLIAIKGTVERLSPDDHRRNDSGAAIGRNTDNISRRIEKSDEEDSDATVGANSETFETRRGVADKRSHTKCAVEDENSNRNAVQSTRARKPTNLTKKAGRDCGDPNDVRSRCARRNSESPGADDVQRNSSPSDVGNGMHTRVARDGQSGKRSNRAARHVVDNPNHYGNTLPGSQFPGIQQPPDAYLAHPSSGVHFQNGGGQPGVEGPGAYSQQPSFTHGTVHPPGQAAVTRMDQQYGNTSNMSHHQYNETTVNQPSRIIDNMVNNHANHQTPVSGHAGIGPSTGQRTLSCSSCNATMNRPLPFVDGYQVPYRMIGISNSMAPQTSSRPDTIAIRGSHFVGDGNQVFYPRAQALDVAHTEAGDNGKPQVHLNPSLQWEAAQNAASTPSPLCTGCLSAAPQSTQNVHAGQTAVNNICMTSAGAVAFTGNAGLVDSSRITSNQEKHDNAGGQAERQATFYLPQTGVS